MQSELNWNDLKFFLAVARLGSMTRAAERLNVTHSTVFRRINSLEAAMNVKLFARLPEGYQLTDIGLDILKLAERVSDRIDDLQRLLDARDERISGVINVTAPHNLAYRFMPAYLAEFRRQYPEIQVNLLVSNAHLNLSRREADLAIRATPSPPEHLIGFKLFSLSWAAYAAPSYIATHGRPSGVEELKQHDLISSRADILRLPAFDWLEQHLPAERIVARCSDLVTMSALAAAGNGIALLPDDQAKPELERLFTFEPAQQSHLWILSHPDMRDNRRLKVFKEFIIEKFRAEPVFQQYGVYDRPLAS